MRTIIFFKMIRFLSGFILKLFGWKQVGTFPEGKKFVVVAAPHTSSWDFVIGRLYYWSLGKSVSFMIKEKHFYFPMNIILPPLGAIKVKTAKATGLVKQMVKEFEIRDEFLLTITPEATRKKVNRWKRGFYYIAKEAEVGIVLGFIDYQKKTMGVGEALFPSNDEEADFEKIRKFYENVSARHPEKYNKDSI